MAAGDLTVNEKWATIEADATARKLTVESSGGSLVNVGGQAVFLSMNSSNDLQKDGLQIDGEIQINPDDSIPLPAETSFVRYQCAAGQSTKLWFIPRAG